MSLFLVRTVYIYNLPFHGIYFLNVTLLTFSEKKNDMCCSLRKAVQKKIFFFLMPCPKVMHAGTGNKIFFLRDFVK